MEATTFQRGKLARLGYSARVATRRKKWFVWASLILIPLLLALAYVCAGVFNLFHAHEHCIKSAGLAFQVELLVRAGIPRPTAQRYFQVP